MVLQWDVSKRTHYIERAHEHVPCVVTCRKRFDVFTKLERVFDDMLRVLLHYGFSTVVNHFAI